MRKNESSHARIIYIRRPSFSIDWRIHNSLQAHLSLHCHNKLYSISNIAAVNGGHNDVTVTPYIGIG